MRFGKDSQDCVCAVTYLRKEEEEGKAVQP